MLHTIREAVTDLHLSERLLRQLIAEHKIPFYRLSSRTLRLDLNEVRDYMRMIAEGRPTDPSPATHPWSLKTGHDATSRDRDPSPEGTSRDA